MIPTTAINYLHTPIGLLQVCAGKTAITSVDFVSHRSQSEQPSELSQLAIAQLDEYFNGHRRHFDLPLALQGTEFQQSVWQQLCEVEYGKTCSYLDIAKQIGRPKAVRAVGAANGKNKIAIIIPCHRIIGANGTLTGYAGGLERKSFLLTLEQDNSHK